MPSAKPLLMTAIACSAIGFASCSSVPTVTGCSELARGVLTTPTPHAEVGSTGDPALDAQLYGIAETAQVNKANDDKLTGFQIINGCEARDDEIRVHLDRPWYRRLLPG
jgi:hypothetical protein